MPSRWFLLALLMFTLSGVAGALDKKERTPKSDTFASTEGRYTVKVAGKDSTDTKQIAYGADPAQTVTRTITKWDAPPPGGTYSVTFADYPELFKGLDTTLLDGARDGVKGPDGLGGAVISEKPAEVGGEKVVGREVVVRAKKNWVRVRLVMVELRLYQVMVTGPEEAVNGEEAKAFLDSFQLAK